MPIRAEENRGFALVFVLWMVVLLAIISASLIRSIHHDQQRVAFELDTLSARLLADGGINRAIIGLVNVVDGDRWPIDGTPRNVNVSGYVIEVSVSSEAGKIDLNAASAITLSGVLSAAGATPTESAFIADRIVAWRSPLDFGLFDTKSTIYFNAGRSYVPRHGAFRSVGELRMVLGMTDEIQRSIDRMLTVITGSPNIDISVASDAVLRPLASAGNQFAALQMSARAAGNATGANRLPAVGEPLTIKARVTKGVCTAERIAIVRLTANSRQWYQVLSWR